MVFPLFHRGKFFLLKLKMFFMKDEPKVSRGRLSAGVSPQVGGLASRNPGAPYERRHVFIFVDVSEMLQRHMKQGEGSS